MAEFNFPTPMVFGHRGACAHAPENTLASFQKAYEEGAEAIELDVKVSSDGEVIVMHDQTLNRTTDGSGDLRKFTLAQLRKLDAGSKFNEAFKGEKIPTLREVLEHFGRKMKINIELTNYATPNDELVTLVVSLVRQFNLEEQVMFSSFNPGNLRKARALCPVIPNGLLALDGPSGWLARSPLNFVVPHEALHPYFTDVNEALIEREHNAGRRVHIWTVNLEAQMRQMYSMGADAIFTDDPQLARKVLKELSETPAAE
jgi:glycerophosphoryl diester phosphodiesterase